MKIVRYQCDWCKQEFEKILPLVLPERETTSSLIENGVKFRTRSSDICDACAQKIYNLSVEVKASTIKSEV